MSETLNIVCPNCAAINRAPKARLGSGETGKCGKCGGPLFDGRPVKLKAGQLHRHAAKDDIPLLIDFGAAWCGPCKTMAPMFEAAAAKLEPRIRLLKIDIDSEQNLARRYNVRSVPTLILLKGGQEVARNTGMMSTSDIIRWSEQRL